MERVTGRMLTGGTEAVLEVVEKTGFAQSVRCNSTIIV